MDISFRGEVGPYDAAVIKSTSRTDPRPLKAWLAENKYYVSDEAGRLIDDYVSEDKDFVAIKLVAPGQGITEIRYIEGLYAFWDYLRAQHPGLLVDNSASGGRRLPRAAAMRLGCGRRRRPSRR